MSDGIGLSEFARHHRRELEAHCRRMLRSREDAEDVVQESLLRAWRMRSTYEGCAPLRSWLYRIATNASLDLIAGRRRRPPAAQESDLLLHGLPDDRFEPHATAEADPATVAESREAVVLALAAVIRFLPPRQRATLILCTLLDCSARDTALLLDVSVASVNSSLQRARRTLRDRLPAERLEWAAWLDPSDEERAILRRYLEAIECTDLEAFVETPTEGARSSSRSA